MRRHLILVGLPGVGKTTVGRMVAELLGAPFVDLDGAIESRCGATITDLFARQGEAGFRALEQSEMSRVLAGASCVVAAGGGWAAQPGSLEAAAGAGFTVYLVAQPEAAADRASRAPGSRPLLAGDPVARMRTLLAARRPSYERCQAWVDTDDADAATVAQRVANLARSQAGWY